MRSRALASAVALCVLIAGCEKKSSRKEEIEKIVEATLARQAALAQKPTAPFAKTDPGDAAAIEAVKELSPICDKIVLAISKDDIDGAFATISKHSVVPKAEIEDMKKQTKEQLELAKPRFGRSFGYERISSRMIGKSVMQFVYIVKCENHILRWLFYFYKPKDKWTLNLFHWDDRIQSLE